MLSALNFWLTFSITPSLLHVVTMRVVGRSVATRVDRISANWFVLAPKSMYVRSKNKTGLGAGDEMADRSSVTSVISKLSQPARTHVARFTYLSDCCCCCCRRRQLPPLWRRDKLLANLCIEPMLSLFGHELASPFFFSVRLAKLYSQTHKPSIYTDQPVGRYCQLLNLMTFAWCGGTSGITSVLVTTNLRYIC